MNTEVIKFHDAELIGELDGDRVWIPIRPICEAIGIQADSQVDRVRKDEILGNAHTVRMVRDAKNHMNQLTCLPIDHVHGWLFSIDSGKVKAEVRPRLLLFKKECYSALYEHFYGNARQARIDAEREHMLLGRNREIDRTIRELMSERQINALELKTIQNRRAEAYHLEPIHDGVEEEYRHRKFLGAQTTIALN